MFLVLHVLTKAPFEPLKEASLMNLTFKTIFLLVLGSDKHRIEIYPCLFKKNIRHQTDWSTPHPTSSQRTSCLRSPWPQWLLKPWPQLWINHSRGIGHHAQLEPGTTIWTGLQNSGRTKSWSLSPLRKVSTDIYLLQLSQYRSGTL